MGHTVNFKSYKDSYKDKRRKITPKEDRMIFENTHEAIVDEETWHTVQRLIQNVRKPNIYGDINPLTGLLYCADCGRKMTNHRSIDSPKNGGFANIYICANYRKHGKRICTMHYIRTVVVQSLVLEAIQKASSFALDNEGEFIRLVREASAVQQEETVKTNQKCLAKGKKRCDELDSLIKNLYENLVAGRLNEKRFDILSAEYEREQSGLEQENIRLQAELAEYESDSVRADKFIETVKKYTDFSELTTTMINEFVEKIIVHEPDRSSGEREQVVDIYLNFIGKFTVPEPEPTPEELAAAEAQRQLRNKRREYNQRYYEKKQRLEQEKSNTSCIL